MGVRSLVGPSSVLGPSQGVLMRIDMKSANGGRHRSQRRIISWDIHRCTHSIASQTRSAFG
jgi:hypothetical protein